MHMTHSKIKYMQPLHSVSCIKILGWCFRYYDCSAGKLHSNHYLKKEQITLMVIRLSGDKWQGKLLQPKKLADNISLWGYTLDYLKDAVNVNNVEDSLKDEITLFTKH